MTLIKKFAAFSVAAALVLGGCQSRPAAAPKPSPADFMEQSAQFYVDEAGARQALAERWRDGDRMIANGNQQQRDAEKTIKSAERDIRRVEREIKKQQNRLTKAQKSLADARKAKTAGAAELADGRKLKSDAEAQFRAAYPDAPLR